METRLPISIIQYIISLQFTAGYSVKVTDMIRVGRLHKHSMKFIASTLFFLVSWLIQLLTIVLCLKDIYRF